MRFAPAAPRVDGILDDAAWQGLDTLRLVRNDGSAAAPRAATRVLAAWDTASLYVAFLAEDRDVKGTITQHDGPLYTQDVVELFLDPDGDGRDYFELEWNCLGTSLDFRFEGPRTGLNAGWTAAGMRQAARVRGTANQPSDVDTGWIVEIALPWSDLRPWSRGPLPPAAGSRLAANFCRIDYPGGPEELTAWSPTVVADFHRPDRFGALVFPGSVGIAPGPIGTGRPRHRSVGPAAALAAFGRDAAGRRVDAPRGPYASMRIVPSR